MAETKRMTAEEVVGYLLEGEGLDFLRESLTWVCQQLMEAEVSELVAPPTVSERRRSGSRTAMAIGPVRRPGAGDPEPKDVAPLSGGG